MRRLNLILLALVLTGCSATAAADNCTHITKIPMTVFWNIEDPAVIAVNGSVAPHATGSKVIGYAQVFGNSCFIHTPAPLATDDFATWNTVCHELRHCQGENHDIQGRWNQ